MICIFTTGFLTGYIIYRYNLRFPSTVTYLIEKSSDGCYQAVRYDGKVVCRNVDASIVMQYAIDHLPEEGGTIAVREGIYTGSKDVLIVNRSHISIIGRGAIFNESMVLRSEENLGFDNEITGLHFKGTDAGIRLENVFQTRIRDCSFNGCDVGIELANTRKWTEFTKIENVYFNNCRRSIVFRTPLPSAEKDYLNTMLDHVAIELRKKGDVGIEVEFNATVGDSVFSNLKIWFHNDNQSGIRWNGPGNGTVIIKPAFESFVHNPQNLYAIVLLKHANCSPYILRPSFIGEFKARVYNEYAKWVYGLGGAFRNEISTEKGEINIGTDNKYGETVTGMENRFGTGLIDPHILIEINGAFQEGEVILVKVIFEYLDNSEDLVELNFTSPGKYSLSEWNTYELLPSCNSIFAIKVQVKTNKISTNVNVTIKAYAWG